MPAEYYREDGCWIVTENTLPKDWKFGSQYAQNRFHYGFRKMEVGLV